MSNAILLQPAFVLHRRDYRNTSLLLDVFSAQFGRVGLIAKGARRCSAPAGPLLQAFRPLLLSWSGRGELHTLTGVEPAAAPVALRGSGLLCGFYVNELLQRLLARGDPHIALFDHYTGTLQALLGGRAADSSAGCLTGQHQQSPLVADARTAMEQHQGDTLRRFELQLLRELGYALVLDHCIDDGAPIDPACRYRVNPESGPRYRESTEHPEHDQARQAAPLVYGSTLLSLASGSLDARGRREAKQLLRAALRPLLGERPMHSRRLYQQYLQLRG